MRFLDPLDVRHVDSDTWFLLKELRCIPDAGPQITVPATTVSDFGSIPRWLWFIFSPFSAAARGYWLHDFLYQEQYFTDELSPVAAKLKCDQLLLESFVALELPPWRRDALYRGLRLGRQSRFDAYSIAS